MLVNRATFFLKEPPTKTKVLLSRIEQLKNRAGLSITSDLMQASPVYADENVIEVIVEILAFHNFLHKSDETAELSIENDGDRVRFNFSNLSQSPLSYYLEKYFDKVGDRLVCKDESWLYEPMCLVVALVEKYGGAVFAKLGSDSTYSLSFALPAYREEL